MMVLSELVDLFIKGALVKKEQNAFTDLTAGLLLVRVSEDALLLPAPMMWRGGCGMRGGVKGE